MNYDHAYAENRGYLWGLCYRMTGSGPDADDLVQDTFIRALEHPPEDLNLPWRPWLVRVAMNLSLDHLRRRKLRTYTGPWLPTPIDTAREEDPPAFEPTAYGISTEARYELLESVSFAFLLALEALSPSQRAVLLLRDVFDYSVRGTSEALELSEANVKTTHHRARETMEGYDRQRRIPSSEISARTQEALGSLLAALAQRDASRIEGLLADEVRALSDGGGHYAAALNPIEGRDRVLRFLLGISAKHTDASFQLRELNGGPAVVIRVESDNERIAPILILRCDLGPDGRISELHSVLAPDKLLGLRL